MLAFVVIAPGCRVCSYRTFEVEVRDAETGAPVEGAPVAEVSGGWRSPFVFIHLGCPSVEQRPTWDNTDARGVARVRLPANERPVVVVLDPGSSPPDIPRSEYTWARSKPGLSIYTVPIATDPALPKDPALRGSSRVKEARHGDTIQLRKAPPWETPRGEHDPPLPYAVTVTRR